MIFSNGGNNFSIYLRNNREEKRVDRERKHAIGFEEIWIRFKGIDNYRSCPANIVSSSLHLEGCKASSRRAMYLSLSQEWKRWGGEARGEVRRGVYRGPLGKTGICWRLALAVLQRFIGATRCVDTSHQTGNRDKETGAKKRLERFTRASPPIPSQST